MRAHDIITTKLTYTRDLSRILAARCLGCHGPNDSIPLTNYQQVRPWAVSIKEQVLSRAMPPWGAVKGFGNLQPDLGLSEEEIMIVAAWVIGGAPRGDPAMLPKPSQAVAAPHVPVLREAVTVDTRTKLSRPLQLGGIKPTSEARTDSARLIAILPDGKVVPLLWLYQFDPAWKRTFTFRAPLSLPAGTIVQSSTPLRVVLAAP